MTAHVRNGRIELDEPIDLPEGIKLDVIVPEQEDPTLLERMSPFVGIVDDLPSDFALNHHLYRNGMRELNA